MAEKDVDVRNLLKSGERRAATNLYFECYGGEFAEVRANIEEMEADDGITGYYPAAYRWECTTDKEFRARVEAALRQGNLITATRLCREHYSGPLKYAKQAVLAWQRELRIEQLPPESVPQEPAEAFDIRWSYIPHPKPNRFFVQRPPRRIEFRFELQIAERVIPDLAQGDAVSWHELAASKMIDGEYGIFTCGCGVMGCGGFSPIEVVHLDNRTLWYDRPYWHIFATESYRAAINHFEEAIRGVIGAYPGVPVEFALTEPSI
jgi:hypothetical protein